MRRGVVPECGQHTTEESWLLVGLWGVREGMRGQKERGDPCMTLPNDALDSVQLIGGGQPGG